MEISSFYMILFFWLNSIILITNPSYLIRFRFHSLIQEISENVSFRRIGEDFKTFFFRINDFSTTF